MKRLLCLLLLGLRLVVNADEFLPQDCSDEIKAHMFIPVNQYRTDWCNPYTGKIEFRQCHDPEKNITIDANGHLQQVRNDRKVLIKCEEQGPFGVIFSETPVKEELSADCGPGLMAPGFCWEGGKAFVPNEEWQDGDFYKRCRNDTFKVETVACRLTDKIRLARGANNTQVVDDPEEPFRIITACQQIDGIYAELSTWIEMLEKRAEPPKPFICITERETFCNPRVNGTDLWDIRIEANEELVIDGIVHGCIQDGVHIIHNKVVGCVSHYGNFLAIGENVTEQRTLNAHSTMRYTSYCLAEGKYDATVEYEREDANAPLQFPERDVLECAPGVTNGETYVEDGLRKRCRFDHRGRFNSTVEACLVINNEGVTETQIGLNKQQRLDGTVLRCSEDETGRFVISPVPKCENGRLLGAEWVIDHIVHSCVEHERNQVNEQVIGCVSRFGNFLGIGENATEGVKIDEVYSSFCLPVEGGAKLSGEAVRDTQSQQTYTKRDIPYCGSNPEYRSGTLIREEVAVFSCEIDHRGRQNITLVGCRLVEAGGLLKLGEVATLKDGTTVRCTATGPSAVVLAPVQECANGKKTGDEWVVDSLVHACVADENKQVQDKVIGCVSYYGNFMNIGENVTEGVLVMQFYNSYCLPVESEAHFTYENLKDAYAPGEPAQKTYQRREIPHCGNDTDNQSGHQYVDGDVLRFCQIDHRGRKNITLIGCRDSERDYTGVPVGHTVIVNGTMWGCDETSDGGAVLKVLESSSTVAPSSKKPSATCANRKSIDEEWVMNGIVYACIDDLPKPQVKVIGCASKYGNLIEIGENVTETHNGEHRMSSADDRPPKTFNSFCLPTREGAKLVTEEVKIPGETRTYAEREVRKCDINQRRLATGEHYIEHNYIYQCRIDHRGRVNVTIRCWHDGFFVPLGTAVEFTPGRVHRCERSGPGSEEWTAIKCDNGKEMGEEWAEGLLVKACERVNVGLEAVFDDVRVGVVVRACMLKGMRIPVGEKRPVDSKTCSCTRSDVGNTSVKPLYAELSCSGNGPAGASTPAAESTAAPSATAIPNAQPQLNCTLENVGKEWKTKYDKFALVRRCSAFARDGETKARVVTVACINTRGDRIDVGEALDDLRGYVPRCVRGGSLGASLRVKTYKPKAGFCEGEHPIGHTVITPEYTVRVCGEDQLMRSLKCRVNRESTQELQFGQTLHENGTLYSCEKRGEHDAELLMKSLGALCRQREETVDPWIDNGVLRDCVRSGRIHEVHARLCILPDDRIIEIGQNITEEFETFKCERKGATDARLVTDQSRIHPDYFAGPGVCKNGKKLGDRWTQNKVIRRACLSRKFRPTIVDLGCLLDDGRLIAVGQEATFDLPAKEGTEAVTRILYCKEGKPGFGATAEITDTELAVPTKPRHCENGRREGEQWADKTALRNCSLIDDVLTVVAVRCIYGNATMEIGELRKESAFVSIECVRVGDHDAAVIIDYTPADGFCENGRAIDEEWEEEGARKVCRARNKRAAVVVLGCVLDKEINGKTFLKVGEREKQKVQMPGYDLYYYTQCHLGEDGNVFVIGNPAKISEIRQDKKSPCGERKYEDVWATGRFLKKCKVIEGNRLSAVTIGCVTLKQTQMLEGQYLVEDDYDLKCARNQDGKLELHYSFTVVEE